MDETDRRRKIQQEYNTEHGIVPETIYRTTEEIMQASSVLETARDPVTYAAEDSMQADYSTDTEVDDLIEQLEKKMKEAAAALEFERAAQLRDEVDRLKAGGKGGGKGKKAG